MKNFLIKLGELLGFFNEARLWLQGKKTYTTNTLQIIAGGSAILLLSSQMLDLTAQSLTVIMEWGDNGQSINETIAAIKVLWASHTALVAGFSAAFYSITDAVSKMSSYAAARRNEKK